VKRTGGIVAALAAITLLSFFQFPGHTYLHQDTQIYIPILENLYDSSVLTRDLLVERPHVAFTLYDEMTVGLRSLTGSGFHFILVVLQIAARGLGCWGIFLIALAILGDDAQSLFVTALFSLGAAIDGPAVLITEYEPSPRALAIPLIFLAIGLVAWRRPVWASIAASVAFVLHPPSVLVFWLAFFVTERNWRVWMPLLIATLLVLWAAVSQPGIRESQMFFSRVTPELERMQRMRASYNWVSMWWSAQATKYLFLATVVGLAYWRVRILPQFFVGLPLIGMLSVPVSYILLEVYKWALVPQIQPARSLLFVTAMAMLLAGICGCLAARRERWPEAAAWFLVAYLPPLVWGHWWLCALLACGAAFAAMRRWSMAVVAVAGFVVIPTWGGVQNYPTVHTRELEALANWARSATPKDSVFAFPDFSKRLEPGVFRSEALRAVYVDWKGGGQVNYLPELGEVWWSRWQDVMLKPVNPAHYRELGISYFVVTPEHRLAGATPVYANPHYLVYRTDAVTGG
jgi:hypothetical protein